MKVFCGYTVEYGRGRHVSGVTWLLGDRQSETECRGSFLPLELALSECVMHEFAVNSTAKCKSLSTILVKIFTMLRRNFL